MSAGWDDFPEIAASALMEARATFATDQVETQLRIADMAIRAAEVIRCRP